MGFEPTTSSMPSRRAPNCATAPPEERLNSSIASKQSPVRSLDRDFISDSAPTLLVFLRSPVHLTGEGNQVV